jgi:hypothetical protein
MTNAVQNTPVVNNVVSVIAQQRRLLKRLESTLHYLDGIVAGLWLPGIDATFDNPVKKITGRRPVFLTVEVAGEKLNFTGAISRLRNDKMVFSPIFAYDVSMPMTSRGGGRVLPANNLVLARRANELLSALSVYGRDVSFGVHTDLQSAIFPEIICDSSGTIFEDYTPVLGYRVANPAKTVKTVTLRRLNPAAKILARHGLETAEGCGPQMLEQLVTEFRAEFSNFSLDVQDIYPALSSPETQFFTITVSFDEAVAFEPQAAVNALRDALPSKYVLDPGYNDLLLAAKHPEKDLRISRFSALQVFPVETVQTLPESYAGTVLAPVNWAPKPVINPAD